MKLLILLLLVLVIGCAEEDPWAVGGTCWWEDPKVTAELAKEEE